MAHFVGVTRPGYQLADSHLPEGAVSLVEVPALAISSTDCRDRVHRGSPVWYLVPDGVVQYIEKRGLYHGPDPVTADGERRPGTRLRLTRPDRPPTPEGLTPEDPTPGDTPSPDLQEIPR
jgi:nicotinate-nucleotide adenylyltransferase